jgi:hypothetical protein
VVLTPGEQEVEGVKEVKRVCLWLLREEKCEKYKDVSFYNFLEDCERRRRKRVIQKKEKIGSLKMPCDFEEIAILELESSFVVIGDAFLATGKFGIVTKKQRGEEGRGSQGTQCLDRRASVIKNVRKGKFADEKQTVTIFRISI